MQWPEDKKKQLLNKELFDAPAKLYLATSAEMCLEHITQTNIYKQGAAPIASGVESGFHRLALSDLKCVTRHPCRTVMRLTAI